jgi:CRISPR-associated protein Cmr2
MTDTLFVFTFGPVQSFIAEARRGQDLWAGSHILSQLARAALGGLQQAGATLIYPTEAVLNDPNTSVPNKLVVRLNGQNPKQASAAAENALNVEWRHICQKASTRAGKWIPKPDEIWWNIWNRQTASFWECHWAALPVECAYGHAYRKVNTLLDAAKRARVFEQTSEDGAKDSLSGRRSALRTLHRGTDADAREYWRSVSSQLEQPDLRPDGREMLDALGFIKRFGLDIPIPSVSSIAANEFLGRPVNCSDELDNHRQAVEKLLGNKLHKVPSAYDLWPYDGDLLFLETFVPERLKDSYDGFITTIDAPALKRARESLQKLHVKAGSAPSPYYAIVMLDGDNIGSRIDELEHANEHSTFSQKINSFAGEVPDIIKKASGALIYAGGDDVLALLPLNKAIETAHQLAKGFEKHTAGRSASAGIAIAHHLSPLSTALREARAAESFAKGLKDKNAVSVHVSKRSGEMLRVRCKWNDVNVFQDITSAIRNNLLSSKVGYDLRRDAQVFATVDDAFKAEIKLVIKRHTNTRGKDKSPVWDESGLISQCQSWAGTLEFPAMFADWVLVARFMAAGGEA